MVKMRKVVHVSCRLNQLRDLFLLSESVVIIKVFSIDFIRYSIDCLCNIHVIIRGGKT